MQKLEMDVAGHKLVLVHDSPTIFNGAIDIVQRLLSSISAVNSLDTVISIKVFPVAAPPGAWQFDIECQNGLWESQYRLLEDELVYSELSEFSLQTIVAIQRLREVVDELATSHGLVALDYDPLVFQVYDSFTASVDEPLPLHVPDIGLGWAEVFDNTVSGADAFVVSATDVLSPGSSSPPGSRGQGYTCQPAPLSANQTVEAILSLVDTGSAARPVGLFARRVDNDNYYALRIFSNGAPSPSMALIKAVAGSVTTMAANDQTIAPGDKFKLEVVGTTIKAYRNGIEALSAVDDSLSSPGTWGLFFGSFGAFVGDLFEWNITEFWAY